jgi:dienelactone hydrolase
MGLLMILLIACAVTGSSSSVDHTHVSTYLDAQGREHPVKTPKDWAIRRKEVLEGMQAAMGPLPDRSDLPPIDMKVTAEVKGDGFKRLTISYALGAGRGERRVPAYLFLPDASAGKRLPAIIALHPTSTIGKGEAAGLGKPHGRYGIELAQRGYVVLCPDYPSFGDYACDFSDPAFASGTMLGIAGHMRGIDLLQSLPQVDPERIGAIGHSLGGHNAMFLAAFDTRVKVVVSSCGWTPFADYYGGNLTGWTSPRYMPRIKEVYHLHPKAVPFDFYEVAAAIAPRPFFSNSPTRDANFDVKGVRKAEPEVRKVYQLLGAPDAFRVIHPDCEHDFPPDVRQKAYRFIDAALKR